MQRNARYCIVSIFKSNQADDVECLSFSQRHDSVVLIRVLEQLADLATVYYPVRHVLNHLEAAIVLRSAAEGTDDKKVDVLTENVLFTLEKNEVYVFCEAFYQRLSCVPEVDDIEFKIGLEPYLG